jgi:hypothetical protein
MNCGNNARCLKKGTEADRERGSTGAVVVTGAYMQHGAHHINNTEATQRGFGKSQEDDGHAEIEKYNEGQRIVVGKSGSTRRALRRDYSSLRAEKLTSMWLCSQPQRGLLS